MFKFLYIISIISSFLLSSDVSINRAELVALNAYQEKSNTDENNFIHSFVAYPNDIIPSIYIFNIQGGGYILIPTEDKIDLSSLIKIFL